MLGTRTLGGKMVGADESTELWRHPNILLFVFKTVVHCLNIKFYLLLNTFLTELDFVIKRIKVKYFLNNLVKKYLYHRFRRILLDQRLLRGRLWRRQIAPGKLPLRSEHSDALAGSNRCPGPRPRIGIDCC